MGRFRQFGRFQPPLSAGQRNHPQPLQENPRSAQTHRDGTPVWAPVAMAMPDVSITRTIYVPGPSDSGSES